MVFSSPPSFTTPAGTPPGSCTLCPLTTAAAEPRVSTMVSLPRKSSTWRVSPIQSTVAPSGSAMSRTGTRVRPSTPSTVCTTPGRSSAAPLSVMVTRSASVWLE